MAFKEIDFDIWPRRERFGHYLYTSPCSYSMTAEIDITGLRVRLRDRGRKLYPATAHMLATIVNQRDELRTTTVGGVAGIYDVLHPSYTVFDASRETFSSLWTPYEPDFAAFHARMTEDIARWGDTGRLFPQEEQPQYVFNLSAVPWTYFSGFQLNLDPGSGYLLPIFTTGRPREKEGRVMMPLAVQAHHAVCDGFHVARIFDEIQQLADHAEEWIL